ncbi:MAG TPA: metal ABC transporter ATP-binding protein [Thermodesulfobacteriota bacterium]|nr:metal ABC transporter ATP-binding protein [Thermodesulfobacteriota bacterium]
MNLPYLVKLEDVAIGYDKTGFLDSINLSIQHGQFWGIIGPNGGGKTTLLKTIVRLIPPVAGKVHYREGKPLIFGYVPQREKFDHIFPISVAEFVAMGRYIRIPVGRSIKKEDRKIVSYCLEQVEIPHLKDRPFRSLSGGEKQRSLIAHALAGEPDVLILDEPTASMDIKGETAIMELIEKIKEKDNLTVLMVSHFLNKVAEFADHVVVVDKDSGVFSAGTTAEVLRDETLSRIFGLDLTIEQVAGKIRIYTAVGGRDR